MMRWIDLSGLAVPLVAKATERGLSIATAESCTGGLITGILTDVPGSSAVVDRGFVTYSNEAKQDMLDVPSSILEAYGAVSPQTAQAMAEGALTRSLADIAVSVTGIAGPGGGSEQKPVGTVHFALATKQGPTECFAELFEQKTRDQIRFEAVAKALQIISNAIDLYS